MNAATAALIARVTARTRRQVVDREAMAVQHLELLAEHGHTQDTCPVCETCPDWINNPPRRTR